MNTPSRWETVNAYVDGELAPADASSFAAQIDSDTALAEQVALVTHLKACTARSLQYVNAAEIRAVAGRPRARWLAWAACVAALLVAVSLLWQVQHEAGATPALIERAHRAHDAFLARSPSSIDRPVTVKIESSLAYLRVSRTRVPDLRPAKLRVVDARVLREGARQGLHVGYLGPHGCRISLVIWSHPRDFPLELTYHPAPLARAYLWRVAAYGYVLLADPMPRARLQMLAETLYDRTRDAAPLQREDRRRLLAGNIATRRCEG